MEIYAPDTNFFLQCSPADQLDWKQVTQADEVVLLVVREVRKELDRLKSGGNARRSKRARAASSLLRRLTTEHLEELVLKAAGPRLVLRTAPRPSPDSLPANFQIDSADERVVAEAYAASASTESGLTFLSHDTVPLEDAAHLGLQTQVIPDEWLLDPEPDELSRQLSDVKRRMTALEGRVPKIVFGVPESDGQVVLTTRYFPSLSDEFIDKVIHAVRVKFRVPTKGSNNLYIGAAMAALDGVDDKRWARYEEEREVWIEAVRHRLHDAGMFFTEDPNAASLVVHISNVGSAGADNLIVRIEALGDFHLVDPDSLKADEDPELFFPSPPARPRSSVIEGLMGLHGNPNFTMRRFDESALVPSFRFHTPAMARDRHAIYWEYESDRNARYTEGQCRDFRHGLEPEEVVLLIERTAIGEETIQGALQILVSAGNLVEANRKTYPVRIESELMDTEKLMRNLLARELGVVM